MQPILPPMTSTPDPSPPPPAGTEIVNSRVFDAPADAVFDAFADPALLARWWGPNGFRNTIHEFDLRPGGAWRLVMHAPDGTDYANVSRFITVERPKRILFDHLEPAHRFRLTMEFDGSTALLQFVPREGAVFDLCLGDAPERVTAAWSGRDLNLITPRGRLALHWIDPFAADIGETAAASRIVAPMPGTVTRILAEPGVDVPRGASLIVLASDHLAGCANASR